MRRNSSPVYLMALLQIQKEAGDCDRLFSYGSHARSLWFWSSIYGPTYGNILQGVAQMFNPMATRFTTEALWHRGERIRETGSGTTGLENLSSI